MSTEPAELHDTRIPPRALLPMRMPVWAMAALAAAMLLVVTVNMMSPRPAAPPAVPAAPTPPRTLPPVQRLSDIMPIPQQPRPELPAPVALPRAEGYAPAGYAPPDAIEADKRRRDYDSLFAENIVARRPEPQVTQAQASTVAPPSSAAAAKPAAGLVLPEGTVIEAVLTNRLEGSQNGPVNVMVTTDVYVGRTRVIPKGSRILGTASRVQDQDQDRLAVAFHRVLTTDGRSISFDKEPGLDQQGAQGFKDQVNRHYWSTFGAAAAVGLLSGLGQWVTGAGYGYGRNGNNGVVVVTSGTDAVAQATAQTMSHFLNRAPKIVIRPGLRVRVYLTSDVTIPEGVGR